MRIRCHQLETLDEGHPLSRARMDQVREVLALHDADIFQSSYGVITQLERLLFDSGEPSLEAREIEGILFSRIHEEGRARRLQLRAAAFGESGNHRVRHGRRGHLPLQRRGNQGTPFSEQSVFHAATLSQRYSWWSPPRIARAATL